MSTLDAGTMREELALQEAIKRQADEVVKLANEAIRALHDKEEGKKLKKSQFSNLMYVAQSSGCVEVIMNYLRYQMGRRDTPWGKAKKDLAHRMIDDIQGDLRKFAYLENPEEGAKYVITILKELDVEVSASLSERAHRAIVQQYIGYLTRAFVYGQEVGFNELPTPKEEVHTNV
jgi:hypothetical protein